jgi:ABC-type sugar transport system permease subunit
MIGQLALIFAAVFVGAAVFVTVAEQPARLALDDRAMLLEWQRSYNRAAPMQGGLAMASALLGLVAAWQMRDWRWAAGAIAILANWPYTLLVIKPTNDRLQAIPPEQSGAEARRMVVSWGTLHAGRSALGIVAVLFYVWSILR